jgi:hypothetical protein
MHFLLMVLRLLLKVLFPSSGNGLPLAARADGRLEHVPQSPWDWLLGSRVLGEKGAGRTVPKGATPPAAPRKNRQE